MSEHYLRLRALVTGDGAYAAMTADDAETALNAATVATAGSALMAPDEFVGRFTPAEFSAARASADPVVQQLMFRLSARRDPLDLASATVQGGLAYMAGVTVPGIGTIAEPVLTPQRAAAIGTVPPGASITPRQQIAWPNERIWAADVTAARKMEG